MHVEAAILARTIPARPAGRPRDRRLDAAVLAATRALLVEVGYRDLSIGAIARRSGVDRPAIYRRWRTKAELVHAAIYPAGDLTLRVRDSGDFARDLRRFARNAVQLFSRPEVMAAIPGLMIDIRHDPSLRDRLSPRLEASARADFALLVERAIGRGEAQPHIHPGTLFDALAGTVFLRIVTAGPSALDGLADELTALLLHGTRAARRPGAKGGRR